jgi:hypothetical protein
VAPGEVIVSVTRAERARTVAEADRVMMFTWAD